jgi:hypothetical protein
MKTVEQKIEGTWLETESDVHRDDNTKGSGKGGGKRKGRRAVRPGTSLQA